MDRDIVDCVCAAVASATVVSAIVGPSVRIGERQLSKLTPVTQLRLVSAAIWLPALVSTLFVLGACLDYWTAKPSPWVAHPQLPPMRNVSFVVSLVFCGVVAHLAYGAIRIYRRVRDSRAAHHDLRRLATAGADDSLLIPLEEPCAFVIGFVRPQVVVSRGLRTCLSEAELEIILAHERAHARRRDPLRQLLASIGLLWHVPGISARLHGTFRLCQELIADRAAVSKSADKQRVANTLVRYAQLRPRMTMPPPAFGDSGIAKRVRSLMESSPSQPERLQPVLVAVVVAVAFGALLLGSDLHIALHHFATTLYQLP